jgi:hypothetical protein
MMTTIASHPLVLAVLQAVQRATADRRPPYYVSVEGLALADYPERIDAAVMLAVLPGWLVAGGKPAHSVAITGAGVAPLRKHDLN